MWKLLAVVFLFLTLSCTHNEKKECCANEPAMTNLEHEHHDHKMHHNDVQTKEVPKAFSEESLFNVKTMWEDNNNKKVTLAAFKSTPVIMTMTYTHCEYSCPLTLKKLESIEQKIKENGFNNYKIVVVSFDTLRDTPQRFQEYMKIKKLDPSRYVFLRSTEKSKIRELAVHLGINFKEESGGEFSHSNVITLLDKNGVIAHQINGIGGDPTDLINKLVKAK